MLAVNDDTLLATNKYTSTLPQQLFGWFGFEQKYSFLNVFAA